MINNLTKTTNNTPITIGTADIEKFSNNLERLALVIRDKITKFSDVPNLLENKYYFLIENNKPPVSFPDTIYKKELKLELEKYIKILDEQINLGVVSACIFKQGKSIEWIGDSLCLYIKGKDSEYRKKFMPALNIILTGYRSAPSLPEITFALYPEEVKYRLQRVINIL